MLTVEQLTESELQQRHSQARLQREMLLVSMGLGDILGIYLLCASLGLLGGVEGQHTAAE
jgi:hypothetical protein